jgi:hypothetical protein
MEGSSFSNGSSLLLIVLGAAYLLIIQYVSKKEARRRVLTEAEMLAALARLGPHSEHELFHLAATDWQVPETQIEDDFKTYLMDGRIPFYVNALMRKKIAAGGRYRPPFHLGAGANLPWLH